MKGRLILTNLIGILVILALIAGGAYYYYQNVTYIKTDDARVAADIVPIYATQGGTLNSWTVKEGQILSKSAVMGKINNGTTAFNVAAPTQGTLIKNQAKEGQMVQPGTALGQIADMKDLYIIANVDEDQIKDIEVGSNVDVTVDGDPNTTIQGNVEEIGYATNSVFSLMPASNTSGSYTKVTQKVQVKIGISNYSKNVLPGMNASIVITKK
ncbi:HlyD family efflux transporter periplasmic adaptor subunit [Paenibacillus sp. JX-17]|uniref:HlyD family efflux transporter periplasmic adaptor subunit n=1 Tax=Paenibacillus lacisoli TaxID=3064525 RepID=A0ABT9C9K3_9BACL|nr:HlyD family efflux transporter periplasmic adaptor subunit [Paenibacillus sp. JX-17]MDO7905943.1 HlyD family efflux transporter periplasmic adaptor subunit [Paenibacillus sp. JX-17]